MRRDAEEASTCAVTIEIIHRLLLVLCQRAIPGMETGMWDPFKSSPAPSSVLGLHVSLCGFLGPLQYQYQQHAQMQSYREMECERMVEVPRIWP